MASFKQYTNSKGTFWEVYAYIGVDENGKKITRHKKGFLRKKEASDWADQVRVEKAFPEPVDYATITYADLYEQWVEQYKFQVRSSTFMKTTGLFKHHILPHFGNKRIRTITTRDCQKAVNEWSLVLVQYKNVFQYFRSVLHLAIDEEIIEKNPCDKVKMPRPKNEDEETPLEFWTVGELSRFLAACEADERKIIYPMFRLFAYTGLRRGELLALRWTDIDFKNETLTVNRSITRDYDNKAIYGPPKNKTSRRTIALDAETVQILKTWQSRQVMEQFMLGYNVKANEEQLIFANEKNSMINTARPAKWLQQICSQVNITPIRLHGLRHTHCTVMLEAGANIKDLQDRLGHSDIETTLNIYAHVNPDRKSTIINDYADYLKVHQRDH